MAFDDKVAALVDLLHVCLQTALAPRPNPPAEVCIVYGEDFRLSLTAGLAEDRCCSGFAGVRLAGVIPQIPTAGVFEACGVKVWQVNLEMGVARCSPFGTVEAGPSCAVMAEVAQQTYSDMGAMVEALCCFRAGKQAGTGQMAPTEWRPFGPEGACTGGIMGIAVQLDACGCIV